MRLRIKVGLHQSRIWSTTTVSVHTKYIKQKSDINMASKQGVTALYVTPHAAKWGSFDPPHSPGSPQLGITCFFCHSQTLICCQSLSIEWILWNQLSHKIFSSINQSINVKFVGRRYTRRPGAPTVVSGTHDQKVHSWVVFWMYWCR